MPLASGAFRGGALAADNLAATNEDHAAPAVHVKDASQPGVLVLRMPSSYVYVSGTLAFKAVVGNGGSVAVSFSDNQGMDWKKIANVKASGEQKIDLTMSVFRRYDYRLKFELTGQGTGLKASTSRTTCSIRRPRCQPSRKARTRSRWLPVRKRVRSRWRATPTRQRPPGNN